MLALHELRFHRLFVCQHDMILYEMKYL